jgi:hypothetical protein
MHLSTSDLVFAVFAAIFLAALILGVIFNLRQRRKRANALQKAAQELGFDLKGDDWVQAGTWRQPPGPNEMGTRLFVLLGGVGRRFANAMTGRAAGLDVCLFDYSYTSGKTTMSRTVAAFSQSLSLPFFSVYPRDAVERAIDSLTHQNISFPSPPGFSERYVVHGYPPNLFSQGPAGKEQENASKIQQLFSPALLAYLEQLPVERKWHIEGVADKLVLYHDWAIRPEYLRAFLDESSSIAKSFLSLCGLARPAA